MTIEQFLKMSPFFDGFTDDQIKQVADMAETIVCEQGQ